MPKAKKTKNNQRDEPLWGGPMKEGITQSMLSHFLSCRHRFYIRTILGLGPEETFSPALEYGNFWHICEEFEHEGLWVEKVDEYAERLNKKYPASREDIFKWKSVCKLQFPLYQKFSKKNYPSMGKVLLREQAFRVPYKLPSGRVVHLKGKWDGLNQRRDGVWSMEHKSKGNPDPQKIQGQLLFDNQTMFYHIALMTARDDLWSSSKKLNGVVYNVVRRPLSGGKGSIRRHQPTKKNPQGESWEDYFERLRTILKENEDEFFMRWEVAITKTDIDLFKTSYLNPILEQLCDWWEWIEEDPFNPFREGNVHHFRFPFGVYRPLTEGRETALDGFLRDGNPVGLRPLSTLFPELEEE